MEVYKREILFYGKPTCPQVPPVRGVLRRAEAPFSYIDISTDNAARAEVRALNEGYESVPTLVFPDGDFLTEPSLRALKEKLLVLGYTAKRPYPWQSLYENPIYSILGAAGLLWGWWDGDRSLLIGGVVILLLVVVWGFWRA